MVERNDTLYVATDTEILASTDSGSTWNSISSHPKGVPAGLVITDAGFYLGLTEGVYRSQDKWYIVDIPERWIGCQQGSCTRRCRKHRVCWHR